MKSAKEIEFYKSRKIEKRLFELAKSEVLRFIGNNNSYKNLFINVGGAQLIPLISPGGKVKNRGPYTDGEEFLPTRYLHSSPNLKRLLESIPGKKHSCRISIMSSNTEMYPHRDHFRNIQFGVIRLHLPIITNPRALFVIENKPIHLKMGHLCYLDIAKTHFASNSSNSPRVHLIADVELNPALMEYLKLKDNFSRLAFNWTDLRTKNVPIQAGRFLPGREKLPFPLAKEMAHWKIQYDNYKWYLTSKNFNYEIIRSILKSNTYQLKQIGPGFQFYFSKNDIHFVCHGAQVVTKKGIELASIRHKVSFARSKSSFKIKFRRSAQHLSFEGPKSVFLFPSFQKNNDALVLTGLAREIWISLASPKNQSQLLKKYNKFSAKDILKALGDLEHRNIVHT